LRSTMLGHFPWPKAVSTSTAAPRTLSGVQEPPSRFQLPHVLP
jgi:hypothetical protein